MWDGPAASRRCQKANGIPRATVTEWTTTESGSLTHKYQDIGGSLFARGKEEISRPAQKEEESGEIWDLGSP